MLDVLMPELSGYQVMDYIKAQPELRSVPVIFLSAKSTHRDIKLGYAKGAQLYLPKPFQPDRLLRNVNLLFEQTPPPRTRKRLSASEVRARLAYMGTSDLTGARHADRVVHVREADQGKDRPPPGEDDDQESSGAERSWLG